MSSRLRMRDRVLAALAASGALAVGTSLAACGGTVGTENADAGEDGGTTGADGATADADAKADATPLPACMFGTPSQACFTHDQLVAMLAAPPRGGFPFDDGGTGASFDPNGCLEPSYVMNDCCNPATSGPTFDGTKCCYTFCTGACCGRALVVDGDARVATASLRDDWRAERAASRDDLAIDATTRRALADAWLADARMEHASIASFARFTLDMMACGAPPELVRDAQRAAMDEIEHAKLCFALASRFAGEALGPGPLDVGSARAPTLAEAAAAAAREGCVGETIAAVTARAQLAGARDREVRAALRRIARDEEAHAELAWRFVAWAIGVGDAGVRDAVARAFDDRALAPTPIDDVDAAAWRAHGRLDARRAREAAREALRDVVAPCARAMLGARPRR